MTVGILDRRTAKAAQQEEQRTEQKAVREYAAQQAESGFDARENPLVRIERETDRGAVDSETEGLSGDSAILQSPNLQSPNLLAPAAVIDDGTDTDKDGLTDFVEVRLSTDPKYSDSDEDGVTDKEEVNGVGGWFGNPTDMDSNRDGLADGLEWDVDSNGQLDDTDGDKLPNAFDPDNDNDGVPDRIR